MGHPMIRSQRFRFSLLTAVVVGLTYPGLPVQAQIQAGDHYSVEIDTPRDYKGTPAGELRLAWRYELVHPEATYIAIHFVDFDLGPGDYLMVSDPQDKQAYALEGRGKMDAGTFWARHIKGDTAVLELVTVSPEGGAGFVIDEYVAGFLDVGPPGGDRAICGPTTRRTPSATKHPTRRSTTTGELSPGC